MTVLLAENIIQNLKSQDLTLTLGIIQIGHNLASNKYIKYKLNKLNELKWSCLYVNLPDTILESDLIKTIQDVSAKSHGVIVQLPIPKHISSYVLDNIPWNKDVDGITFTNQGKLFKDYPGNDYIAPCTAEACMHFLLENKIPLHGRRVGVFGRSSLVGKPITIMLQNYGATVINIAKEDTKQWFLSKECSVIISAMGLPHYITQEYINEDAFIVDIGVTIVEGKNMGDVHPKVKAKHITPVIGGIGPMTIAFLMNNLAKCAKWQI